MDYIFVLIFGLVIGSFLNVCIYRIPREESICYPPSHCTNCSHKLGLIDLVPVLSYMCLRGKCRYCGDKISIRYPLIELLNGILYLLIYLKYGIALETLKYCILVSILVVISMIDFDTQDIYTSIIIFAAIIGIVFVIIEKLVYGDNVFYLLAGAIAGAAIIGLIVFITKGMGEGDIEIAGVCGLFLGLRGILLALFLSVICGGIVGIFIVVLKLKKVKDKIAFGPFIALGTFISIMYGNEIISWYLRFLF